MEPDGQKTYLNNISRVVESKAKQTQLAEVSCAAIAYVGEVISHSEALAK